MKLLKISHFFFLYFLISGVAFTQSADNYFNQGANEYIDGDKNRAVATLNEGIRKFPNDEYLPLLKKKILEEQEDQDQKDQQNQDQKDQEKSEEEKKSEDAEKKESEDQKSEEEKQQEESEKSDDQKQEDVRQKLEEMNISEEKAKMILEALKNNEIQYIQQRKRKATEKPESGKPDW